MPEASIQYRSAEFTQVITKYEDLATFRPKLDEGWFYLGPVAGSPDSEQNSGLIVKPNDAKALDDIADWKPVFTDIEGRQFSTWHGIARNPTEYTVIGHFFVVGTEKPTKEQTAGIKAIRRDLISKRSPRHRIWEYRLPKAILTLWDVIVVDKLHVATGAFVSTGGDDPNVVEIGVLRFNAW